MIRIINLKNGCILSPVDYHNLRGQYWYGLNGYLMNIITRPMAETMLEPARSYILAAMDELETLETEPAPAPAVAPIEDAGIDLDFFPNKPYIRAEPKSSMKDNLKPEAALNLILERLKGILNNG
jgi:hypothetical protein